MEATKTCTGRCNAGLANYDDLPELLRLAADYLEHHGEK